MTRPTTPGGIVARASRRLQAAWAGRGPLAVALLPLAAVYLAVVTVRRGLYRIGLRRTHRLPVPVVVVGNLIVGGSGKTPTVIATVEILRRLGFHPGIVSRGFGGHHPGPLEVTDATLAAACGDEPRLLRRRTGAPTVIGRDRVAAARHLLRLAPAVDVVVSDDGLQHRALGRDVEILVFDERGTGNGWPLPAGPLREPLPGASPDRSIVLYNAPKPSTPLPGFGASAELGRLRSLGDWQRGGGRGADLEPDPLPALRRRTGIAVAAGLGRPERFFAMLRRLGLDIAPIALPDHHAFETPPWPAGTHDVIVTEKDAVKLDARLLAGPTRVWVAPLDFRPEPAFEAALARRLIPRRAACPPRRRSPRAS